MVKKHPNQNQGYIAGRRDSSSGNPRLLVLGIILLIFAAFLSGWIVAGLVPLP